MDSPLISIIVPVYKVEEYLRQCVDSILNQTYKNLEIILVDDGSPDGCPQICDEYAKRDARIKVIHKMNGGLSDARNAGLDIATGDYIGFVDSDDWIKPQMYEELVQSIEDTGADISVCGYTESNGNRDLQTKSLAPVKKIYSVEEAFREVLLSGEIMVVMWNKIYRGSLFEDIRFPVGETFEDGAVFYKLFDKCKVITHTGTALYYYRKRPGSITFTDFDEMSRLVIRNNFKLDAYLKEKYPTLLSEARFYNAEIDYYLIVKYLQNNGSTHSPTYNKLKNKLQNDLPIIKNHPRWSNLKKLKVRLVLAGVYTPVRTIYHRAKLRV